MPSKLDRYFRIRPEITWQGFLLYSPISILGFPVSVLIVNENTSPISMLGYGFFLTALTFAVYVIQMYLFNKISINKTIRILIFILVPIITGAVRGYLFFRIVDYLKLTQPSDLSNRIFSSIITTIFWLTLANYVVSVSRKFLFQYQSALNQYLRKASDQLKTTDLSPKNASILGEIQLNLAASVEAYIAKDDPESFRKMSAALTQQINAQIRPISRRIWVKEISEFPLIRYGQLFKDTISLLNFSWQRFIFLITCLSLIGNLAIRNFPETFWRTASFLAVMSISRFIYDRIQSQRQPNKILFNSVWLILFGFTPVLLSEFFVDAIGYSGSWYATIIISPVAPVLMVVLTLLNLANQDRNLMLEVLRNIPNTFTHKKPGELEIETASVASYLHNSLQSELLALSKQLEEAAENPDHSSSAELLQKVSSTVNRSIADDFLRFNESPKDRLLAVVNSWHGILEIRLNFDINLLVNNEKAAVIVQTIEEVATNIARYDNATKLKVTADAQAESMILKLQSNGNGKIIKAKGLGSSWFNQVALSEWTIEKNAMGSLLSIEI